VKDKGVEMVLVTSLRRTNQNALDAVSNDMPAVKHCFNKILRFLTEGSSCCRLSCIMSVLPSNTHTHTHTHTHLFNGPFPGLPGFYWSKRQWVAVASAGPYASLHLAPDRWPCQHLTTQFFTGRMPFLPPNQQCQSTEGKALGSITQ